MYTRQSSDISPSFLHQPATLKTKCMDGRRAVPPTQMHRVAQVWCGLDVDSLQSSCARCLVPRCGSPGRWQSPGEEGLAGGNLITEGVNVRVMEWFSCYSRNRPDPWISLSHPVPCPSHRWAHHAAIGREKTKQSPLTEPSRWGFQNCDRVHFPLEQSSRHRADLDRTALAPHTPHAGKVKLAAWHLPQQLDFHNQKLKYFYTGERLKSTDARSSETGILTKV